MTLLKRYPKNPWFWKALAWSDFLSGREDIAAPSMDRALELVPEKLPQLRAEFLRTKAAIISKSKPETSLKDLMSSFILDGRDDLFIDALQRRAGDYFSVSLEKCLKDLSPPKETTTKITELFHVALDGSFVRRLTDLDKHLRDIAQICRKHGTRIVFLDYPAPRQRNVENIIRRVAEEEGASYLALNSRFDVLLKTRGIRDKILKDGSPTDESSRYVAESVRADLQFRAAHR